MQLLSVKSMIRYGPPKYTAGFARSFVRGYRRSPTPPASRMTRISSSSMGIGKCLGARWSPCGGSDDSTLLFDLFAIGSL
jgi:hypothetical protein